LLFHLQQLLALALHHLGHRDAGGARDDFGDLLGADLRAQQLGLPPALRRRLAASAVLASFSCFSSCGSLPYCSSDILLPVALALRSSICELAACRSLP
jgi:hypothetical protein